MRNVGRVATTWKAGAAGSFLGSNTSNYFRLSFPFRVRSIYHELGHFYFFGGPNRMGCRRWGGLPRDSRRDHCRHHQH